MRPVPAAGISLIRTFEGLHKVATRTPVVTVVPYVCPAQKWTIAYGHLCDENHPPIGEAEADAYLEADLAKFATAVLRLLPIAGWDLSEGQFGALVSLTLNIGPGNLSASTLLRKVRAGDMAGAADEFPRWRMGGGKILPGLVLRREAERTLFLGA